jgi:lysozyme family protein
VTDSDIVEYIIERFEGSAASNDPDDRGGITRFGVTLPTLKHIKPDATAGDVWALTKQDAINLYLELFVFRPGFHQIADWRLRLVVIDSGIHSGTKRATEWLQAAVGAQVDGHGGRDTYAKVASADPVKARERVIAARLRHLGALIARDVRQAKFSRGWFGRVATLLEAA